MSAKLMLPKQNKHKYQTINVAVALAAERDHSKVKLSLQEEKKTFQKDVTGVT